MSTIRVHTTQNVSLEYEVASVGDRIVAAIIDYLVLFAWLAACGLLFALVAGTGGQKSVPFIVVFGIVAAVPYVFYHLASEIYFNGQSIGKKARHIKVIRLDGTQPQLGDYLLRWLLRLIDMSLPVVGPLVAIITILANGRGQRLGDMAAGTTVVSTRPRQAAGALAPVVTPPDYVVVFPQADQLADHDVATIRQLLQKGLEHDNYQLLHEVANKVKDLTGIYTELPDEAFLRTVIRDHAHLAAMQG
ncbi:RDD family protein [Hymenobacter sp. BT186]|uniref:RDD family protein n=1 Tax=Hymenobacter telluris TaxID=2816474 RepID=A0A939EY61_9BACT|nr:RDD family protein [Hymenobacter telluris]MBO0358777.1 RDD family protein [Hymenobacter telluris]MBW3374803.1 RDD family protein [Hymenobacter norwichensis]